MRTASRRRQMGSTVLTVLRSRAASSDDSEESFADVFNAHHRRAVSLAWMLTGDPHLAEDVVAEAFARVWVQWDRGRVDDVGPYLRRAVVNTIRSRGRRRQTELRERARRKGDDRGVQLLDERAADRDEVWSAVQRLPQRQRATLVLRYYEDLSVAETAEVLDVSPGTVKSQTSRAMDHLREILGDQGAGAQRGGA